MSFLFISTFIIINGLPEEAYTAITYSQKLLTTSLTIEDKTRNFNYGFSFVRELKLFSSFNLIFGIKVYII